MSNSMPKEAGIDHSLDLLKEGYQFVSNRCQAYQSDIFETHLLGERAICMRGSDAAELFYDNSKFSIINGSKKEYVKKGIYHLNNINSYHSRLKKWIRRFNLSFYKVFTIIFSMVSVP